METRFAEGARFVDGDGRSRDLAQLRGTARGVVLFYLRAATCLVCVRHARTLAAMGLADDGIAAVAVVPGGPAQAARVRRSAGAGITVVSSQGDAAHRAAGLSRTLLLQHSGTLLVDARGVERYRRAGALPTGSFDAEELRAAVARL